MPKSRHEPSKTAATPAAESIKLPSGAVLHTWRPSKPAFAAIVVQHGFGESAARWEHQHHQLIRNLLDQGWEVWGMDLLGHGVSPGPRGSGDVRVSVRDHLEVRRRAGASGIPVAVLGHSLGGLVTAGSVAANPNGLAGAVLLSPALPTPPPKVIRNVLLGAAKVAPEVRLSFRHVPASELSRKPGVSEAACAFEGFYSGPLSLKLGATALEVAATLQTGAASWTVPTLIAHGTADKHTDATASERFSRQLATDDVTLELYEGAKHELLEELDADATLELILTWLAAHL